MSPAIRSVSRSDVDSKLQNSFANRLAIPKIASHDRSHPFSDSRLCLPVAQVLEPRFERTSPVVLLENYQVEHGLSLA